MAKKKELTPEELEQQADALLAAADAAEEAAPKQAEATKSSKKASKRGVPAEEEPPHVMTDEEAKKAGIVRLDDIGVCFLPHGRKQTQAKRRGGAVIFLPAFYVNNQFSNAMRQIF